MRLYTKENINRIEKFLKESVEMFKNFESGCCKFNLDDNLGLFVGWLPGYDTADNKDYYVDDKGWGLNAGIKIRNDFYFADFDFLNAPIWNDDEFADTDVTISRQEDFRSLARYYLKEYIAMKKFIDKGQLSVNI